MPQLLRSPWHECFDLLLDRAATSLVLCSPFIGAKPCARVRERASGWPSGFQLLILTDLSRDNMLSGATDVAAIHGIAGAFPQTEIRFLPSLHAKVYVADEKEAVVTSGNMTESGLVRNFEYGVRFTEPGVVRTIREDVLHYAALGSPIDLEQLQMFVSITGDLREMRKAAEKSLKARLRREFGRKLREADDRILQARAAGRAPHAIFADAIRHLLRYRPMTTVDLHRAVQQIHPDLCDDTVERVIDGKHFGKKWKHAVRTAQQHLKKLGEIELVRAEWRLTP